jgi:hypothetical protein
LPHSLQDPQSTGQLVQVSPSWQKKSPQWLAHPPQRLSHNATQDSVHALVQQDGAAAHTQPSHRQPSQPGPARTSQPVQNPQSSAHEAQSSSGAQ